MRNAWMIVAGLAVFAGPALAQSEEESAPPAAESSDKPAAKTPGTLTGKRLACKESGAKNGLKGFDLQDHMQLCIEEARLACLKDAIAQKARGKDRKDFMVKCMETAG